MSHERYLKTLESYENSKALLQHYKIQLSRHTIKAMHDGIVTNMFLKKGTYVKVGQPLFTIIDKKSAYIQANFIESSIKNIHLGDKAKVIISTSGKVYYGTVEAISSGISIKGLKTNSGLQEPIEDYNWFPIPRRVPVYIKLKNVNPHDNSLINGTHARAYIL